MQYPRTARQSVEHRRKQRPRRLSWLAIYLVCLNLICGGLVVSLWLPERAATAQSSTLPTAQVLVGQLGVPVSVAAGIAQPAEAIVAAPTPDGPLQAGPVPILMYHYIRTVDAGADPIGYNLSVAPELFDAQMAWLRDNGYATVSMATAQRCIAGEPVCPPNAIALTFDDGYLDAYTDALPTLQRYGFIGTFYLVNNFMGQPGYMSWEQAGEMNKAGMEIGAHTLDHLDLTVIDQGEARRQIEQSKIDIEARLGVIVSSFCYPSGRYTGETVALVRELGFANATTTRWDDDYSDPFAYPRRRIEGGKDVDVFAAVVWGY